MVVTCMAKDSIELIREAEIQAQELVAKATAEAERIVAQAHITAQEQYAETVSSAKQAAQEALEASREEGARMAKEDEKKYEEQCNAVRAAAEKKRDAAIGLVIKRITE